MLKCHFFKSGAEIFVILLILGAMGLLDDVSGETPYVRRPTMAWEDKDMT
jgi:hypothetical protein